MAKIGTVQIEIQPHMGDDALEEIAQKVADAVERGVRQGLARAYPPYIPVSPSYPNHWYSTSTLTNVSNDQRTSGS